MIALTGYTLPDYLINRGLLSYADLAGNQWQFIENRFSLTRNANFVVQYSGKTSNVTPDYFLKQPVSLYLTEDGLQLEEDVLYILGQIEALKSHLLEFVMHPDGKRERVQYDSTNRVLLLKYQKSHSFLDILDGLVDKYPRRDIDGRTRQIIGVTKELGITLARFSDNLPIEPVKTFIEGEENRNKLFTPALSNFKPWLLELTKRDISQLQASNSIHVVKLADLLRDCKIIPVVDALKKGWDHKHLINLDSNLSNVLVVDDSPVDESPPRILLIDWEATGYGPELWPLAGMVANFLAFMDDENPPVSEEKAWGHLHALISGYFQNRTPASDALKILFQYAGIVLLQQYYSWASVYLHSGNSVHADKLELGKDCLLNLKYNEYRGRFLKLEQ